MSEPLYIDLLIENGDFSLNTGREPMLCHNRVSIGQDCVHAILESGLVTQLVAERSPTLRADVIMQMVLLLEDDTRIIPGTVVISEETLKRLWVTAETYDFGKVEASVNYDNETAG
ncbi:DUF2590 family protein [Serratia marcescens]|uniref:DUF2590 family protein n=1 Tax=Serratia marcescens TaxID=615 RepID=UPI003EDB4C4C